MDTVKIGLLVREQENNLNIPLQCLLEKLNEEKKLGSFRVTSDEVAKVIIELLFSAKCSIESVLKIAEMGAFQSKDCFPIARGIVETCINVCYIMAEGKSAADAALSHSIAKGIKKTDMTFGSSRHSLHLKRKPVFKLDAKSEASIRQFTSKKGRPKNWTDDSVPQRILKVEKYFGVKCSTALNGAYAYIYNDASEVIHGTLAGAQLVCGRLPFHSVEQSERSVKEHFDGQLDSAFLAIYFAIDGVLRAFGVYYCKKSCIERTEQMNAKLAEALSVD